MARPRASERADYGLVWLQMIDAYGKGTISLECLGEIMSGYYAAKEAYRAGDFDATKIPPPEIFALWPEDWQRHLETFVDGIADVEKRRRAWREKRTNEEELSPRKTPENEGIIPQEAEFSPRKTELSPRKTPENEGIIPQEKRREGEEKVKRKEKKSEGNSRAGARELPPSPPSGSISSDVPPMSLRAYETVSLLTRSHAGEKPYDPVSLAMMVCQLPTEDGDNRRPFGKELARVGPIPFLDAVDKCYKAALADRKAVTPSVLQRAFADLPAAEAS